MFNHVKVSLYPDDVALWSQNSVKEKAGKFQHAVQAVADWSQEMKLELNIPKCEVAFFTSWCKKAVLSRT